MLDIGPPTPKKTHYYLYHRPYPPSPFEARGCAAHTSGWRGWVSGRPQTQNGRL